MSSALWVVSTAEQQGPMGTSRRWVARSNGATVAHKRTSGMLTLQLDMGGGEPETEVLRKEGIGIEFGRCNHF
jgi:hypothetical protein